MKIGGKGTHCFLTGRFRVDHRKKCEGGPQIVVELREEGQNLSQRSKTRTTRIVAKPKDNIGIKEGSSGKEANKGRKKWKKGTQ